MLELNRVTCPGTSLESRGDRGVASKWKGGSIANNAIELIALHGGV